MHPLTLTLLSSDRGAFEILPDTDPASGAVTFTARASRHKRALTQAFLGGYGVSADLSGSGRSEAEDLLYLRARARAYATRVTVVRHATFMHEGMLTMIHRLAVEEGFALALTCDETVGADLGAWVAERGGECHEDPAWLLDGLDALAPGTRVASSDGLSEGSNADSFPTCLPEGDFYIFRARCRDLLPADQFAEVDDLYVSVAREVLDAPFNDAEAAAEWIRARWQAEPGQQRLRTIARAAQAAMFRCGSLLKCDLTTLAIPDTLAGHRRLTSAETLRLRGYRQTWRAAARVLRDAGLTEGEIDALRLDGVSEAGSIQTRAALTPEGASLLAAHRHLRLLEGANGQARFITEALRHRVRSMRTDALDLDLPILPDNTRTGTSASTFQRAIGVSLLPLNYTKTGKALGL